MNWGLLIFIMGILVVVMIHEAGHFFVAKFFNFKATKFFVGFGPTLWSRTRGETEYGIKALPLGGFVKIVGMNPYEDVEPQDEERSYANKPRWQRALVLVAGSATHWVVAFTILVVTTMTIGFPTGEASTSVEIVETSIDGERGPAYAAGIRPGDRIVGVGGTTISSWQDIRGYIRARAGDTGTFTVERDGRSKTFSVDLGHAMFDDQGRLVAYAPPDEGLTPGPGDEVVGFLGVQPAPEFRTQGFFGAIGNAGSLTWDLTYRSFRGIGDVFTMVFGGELWDALTAQGERELGEGPLGIVGAGQLASDSFESGRLLDLIGLIVGFTIFVGLMNLLPLPPLDGGHLAVVGYEAVVNMLARVRYSIAHSEALRSAPGSLAELPARPPDYSVDVRKLIPIAVAVISFFVLLFVAVLYLDLARPIRVPF